MEVQWYIYFTVTVGGIPNQTKDVKNHDVKANWSAAEKERYWNGEKYLNIYMLWKYIGQDAEISKDVYLSEWILKDILLCRLSFLNLLISCNIQYTGIR